MIVNIQTLKDIRLYIDKELKGVYPREEIVALTNIILKTKTGITKLHQLYNNDHTVTEAQAAEIIEICNELSLGKPLQYILGETFFYGCTIRLNSSTLIPRPETEELVDLIIRENKDFVGRITDFGTGSGCIAIALAANLPGSAVTGIDISEDAILKARENAVLNNVSVSFTQGDIFNPDYNNIVVTEIIVSNPPYVLDSEKLLMNRNVIEYEPPLALFVPDSDPLKYYRGILDLAEKILTPGGKIYFEINEKMGQQLSVLLKSYGYSSIEIIKDINDKERIIKGTSNVRK